MKWVCKKCHTIVDNPINKEGYMYCPICDETMYVLEEKVEKEYQGIRYLLNKYSPKKVWGILEQNKKAMDRLKFRKIFFSILKEKNISLWS